MVEVGRVNYVLAPDADAPHGATEAVPSHVRRDSDPVDRPVSPRATFSREGKGTWQDENGGGEEVGGTPCQSGPPGD